LASFDLAVALAALGITTLELVEAAAVGLALYGDSRKHIVFAYVALGTIVVLVPTLLLGRAIALLPIVAIRIVGGALLLYFGIRLIRSARRSVLRQRKDAGEVSSGNEESERGINYTAFSVGAIEAFEAAIVLIGLLPNNYDSTLIGLGAGVVIVVGSTYILRSHVRKIKQANMKVIVSALLLSFASFWFAEAAFPSLNDLILIPLFVAFALMVGWIANRPTPVVKATPESKPESPKTNTNL
jgi:uncharacterized membrane protein